MGEKLLPTHFSHLEMFVKEWALANERDRYHKLHGTTLDQLRVFYDAMLPEMDAVMEFLKGQPLEGMTPPAENLFRLAMTFAETAHPIDLAWKDIDFPSAYRWQSLEFTTVSTQF